MSEKLFIGLTGNPGSGKTTTAEHLHAEHGFEIVRVSSVIRQYASEHEMPLIGRDDYLRAHLAMSAEHGDDYDIRSAFQIDSDRVCIDGVRIVRQVEALRKIGGVLIAHWCPVKTRFERSLLRADAKDKPTLSGFLADEAQEYQSTEPPYPSVLTVMQMADMHLDTTRPLQTTLGRIDGFVTSQS